MASHFVHESAYLDDGCTVGEGTKIWHFSHVQTGAVLGKKCIIGQNVYIAATAILGNNCKIQNNVSIYDNVELEDEVFCGPSMVFTNVFNPRAFIERKHEYRKTLLKRGCTIGANATIVCGSTIGEYALVGAGSVVTKDVPAYALVYGTPGRIRGWVCKCGVKLAPDQSGNAVCPECSLKYKIGTDSCVPLN